ncbi:MAG TPA: acyclic terpene utilization AtuA family protein [Casimicrobiaceae bacterium]|nr:acyclic terpene utilization AtuA family protein [Casimicrobiaceae bacterium]
MRETLRIGAGAGFSGDRLEPAVVLAERGRVQYLVLECLGERTVALAQLRRRRDPARGYDPLLERRIELLLPLLRRHGVRLVTNMGAANPIAAADAIIAIARTLKTPIRVAVVTGDDVLARIEPSELTLETQTPIAKYGELVSANAYLGTAALLPALQSGADIVITGRVADPSLFLAPVAHEYGWQLDDVDRLARGTSIGHLLECAGQLCGGYFAEPGRKDVPDMAHLGFPYADVDAHGNATLSKVEGTGGCITLGTAKEQLLYEVTDPFGYVTPDVVADFSTVTMRETAPDTIEVRGATGRARPAKLKVSVGYLAGYVGEGEISYGGANALGRARLAGEIIRQRLGGEFSDMRIDLIGSTSLHGKSFDPAEQPYEIRLRVAARAPTPERAALVGEEVEALYTNGPAGGGGTRKYVQEQIGIVSTLIERERVSTQVTMREWTRDAQAA